MNCWSVFKTFILCQLSDNRSLQGYSHLTFPSLVGPPHSELHYSSSYVVLHTVRNVGPPHLGFPFPVGLPRSSLCSHSFQSF